jgi:quinolinate synthase
VKIFIVHPEADTVIGCIVETFQDFYRKGKGIVQKPQKRQRKKSDSSIIFTEARMKKEMYDIRNCTAVVELNGVLDLIAKEDIQIRVILMPDLSSKFDNEVDKIYCRQV